MNTPIAQDYYVQQGFKFPSEYPIAYRGYPIGVVRPFIFLAFCDEPTLTHQQRRYMRLYEYSSHSETRLIPEPEAEVIVLRSTNAA